jgi:hypothetical protein
MRHAKTGLVLIALCAVSCYATGDGTGALASAGQAFEAASTYVSEAPTYVHSKRSESSAGDAVSNKRQKLADKKGKGKSKKHTYEKPDNNFVALCNAHRKVQETWNNLNKHIKHHCPEAKVDPPFVGRNATAAVVMNFRPSHSAGGILDGFNACEHQVANSLYNWAANSQSGEWIQYADRLFISPKHLLQGTG